MNICLVLVKPDQQEEVLVFDKPTELTFGRSSACTCCLDFDPLVSRMHAVLLIDPPTVRIRDLNSTNGLIVNGELYGGPEGEKPSQTMELRIGDEVIIGSTIVQIRRIAPSASRAEMKTSLPAASDSELGRTRVMRKEKKASPSPSPSEDTVTRKNPIPKLAERKDLRDKRA